MKAYKGFNKDLTCTLGRGTFQYQEGMTYREGEANCVRNGFHAAENPLDCLSYYPDWDNSVYYEVDAGGDIDEDGRDSKIACTELTLVKKLELDEFTVAAVKYMIQHPKREWTVRSGKVNVRAEAGTPKSGTALIIRGKNPEIAPVQKKDIMDPAMPGIVAFVKEHEDSQRIAFAQVFVSGLPFWRWEDRKKGRTVA